MALTYKESGVDIDAGNALVSRIGPMAKATMRPEVLGGIGGFAALCALPTKYREPIFFLDYFATGALNVDVAAEVIRGIADGCLLAGCALVGGETAEMPGLYQGGDYDLAGFCVGVVEKSQIRPFANLAAGDIVIGLPSAGLHANGHSLARRVLLDVLGLGFDDRPAVLGGASVADALLAPTIIYGKAFASLTQVPWKAAAHMTGGGIIENPPRIFRDDTLAVQLDTSTWDEPGIFALIRSAGVTDQEMHRTFNCGIGMIIVVAADAVAPTLAALAAYAPRPIGQLVARDGGAACQLLRSGT